MQKEFVNIAAREIRTPIQPILGLTVALRSKMIKPIGVGVAQSVIGYWGFQQPWSIHECYTDLHLRKQKII
jgi:hypothetical protein